MIGIRIKDPTTGIMRLDTADYTVSVYYSAYYSISGSGSLNVPGIDSTSFSAFLVPADEPPQLLTYWNNDARSFSEWINRSPYIMPKVKIVGSTVQWTTGVPWYPRRFIVMVLRFR